MPFDFDEIIDRRNTHSSKWDSMQAAYGVSPDEGIPMWVADMDFKPPQAVNDALQAAVDHGVHGYFGDRSDYDAAVCGWMARRHDWAIKPEWIAVTTGLVPAIGIALRGLTEPGDGVIVFSPVYHSFYRIIEANQRQVVESELMLENGVYHMDLDVLEAQLTGNEKMMILCSPHNPGGRVWTVEELRAVADFCIRHDLILISDEVHFDLVYRGNTHSVMAKVAPEVEDRLITLVSMTKTFNIAGIETGNAIISNGPLRRRFDAAHSATGKSPNRYGMLMGAAAYAQGDEWLDDLLPYLDRNRQIMEDGLNAIPGVRFMPMQATYLSWVDFSGTGMERQEFTRRVERVAKIAVNHGNSFGKGGESFLRFNFATRRALVEEAVSRVQAAFSDLQ